jgi:hypothetical protein
MKYIKTNKNLDQNTDLLICKIYQSKNFCPAFVNSKKKSGILGKKSIGQL